MSGRRVSSQHRYDKVVEVVSEPATLYKIKLKQSDTPSYSRETNNYEHVTHVLRDGVLVRHNLTGSWLAKLKETLGQGDLLRRLELPGGHLLTGFVHPGADKLRPRCQKCDKVMNSEQSTDLSHDLIRVAQQTPTLVGNAANQVPSPCGNRAALLNNIREGAGARSSLRLTKMPRLGKSPIATERGSWASGAHRLRAPSRWPKEETEITSTIS